MDLPSEVTRLLTPEITAAILKEGVGSEDVFFLLTDQDLKDLGFNMGARRLILNMKPREATQNQNMTNSQLPRLAEVVDVQIVSPVITAGLQVELPADAQVIPPVADFEPGPAATHQPLIDILAILRRPQIRRKVIDGAELAEKLLKGDVHHYHTDYKQSERKFLVRTLGAYLMKACAIMDKPSKEEKILMARSITETFPALRSQDTPNGWELYYDPVSHTGFLEQFIRGSRSSDPNIPTRAYGKRKHEVEASTSVMDANNYMSRNKVTTSNKTEMEAALDITREQRRNWILGPEKPSITLILRKYPRFQDMNASIRQEFLAISKSYSSFQEEWRKVEGDILDIALSRKPLGSEGIFQNMDPEIPESVSLAAFRLLPFLLPCHPCKGKKEPRLNPEACGQLLIAEFRETSLQEALNTLEERGMKQPGIFTIEDAYYLKLDKTAARLSASNIVEAVEYLLMSFYVFNVEYPYQLKSIFSLFEYICKIRTNVKSAAVNVLIKLFK
ncbi:hypothetical protein JTE90_005913 [Oedothorax gibbosus]|uniref:SAM domain-containing protein n=1 Tax=Oedothorax gibbosus TaxID=931172 RepID=A0AAV6UC18_9ARAC|nr:hypothetical protein JTE90_005913 [Oedothorax gibbosus]